MTFLNLGIMLLNIATVSIYRLNVIITLCNIYL